MDVSSRVARSAQKKNNTNCPMANQNNKQSHRQSTFVHFLKKMCSKLTTMMLRSFLCG